MASRAHAQWMYARLRAMGAREIVFRVGRKLHNALERAGWGRAHPPVPRGAAGPAWVAVLPRRFDVSRYARAAEQILGGRFDVFALKEAQLGFPPQWNVDPKTGTRSPLRHGKALNYRDRSLVGDSKYQWEINRHYELVTLAQAWHLTGDERYARGCVQLLDSWFSACPYPLGMAWCVSLEHAVRLANWSFAWHLLGGVDSPAFRGSEGAAVRDRWLQSIYRHCHFIAGHGSRHSSANNHLLGEAAGLLIGAASWPLWPESRAWLDSARAELEREALRQNAPDGVNREQALWYHLAVADMMLIAGLIARASGIGMSDEYWQRLAGMLEFIRSVMDVGGHVPAIGDEDAGLLTRLEPRQASPYRSLLASGAILFSRRDFALAAGGMDDKTRWLFGDDADERLRAVATSRAACLPVRRAFEHGGYFVLGERLGSAREVRIVADAGPLGYLGIAAHGHADALSFTLSAAGQPLLVDPGTYAYGAPEPWRHYFRGTSAHNTVRIDGADQSEYRGSFLWLRHARVEVLECALEAPTQRLAAQHSGYRRLPDPVTHRRTWCYRAGEGRLIVTDEIVCAGPHRVELFWHFAPECRLSERGGSIIAERRGVRLTLRTAGLGAPETVIGRSDPPLGWFAPAYDVKVPAPAVVFAAQVHGSVRVTSQLDIEVSAEGNTVSECDDSLSAIND